MGSVDGVGATTSDGCETRTGRPGVGSGVGLGVGSGVGLGVGSGVGLGVGSGVGLGVGIGDGCGVAPTVGVEASGGDSSGVASDTGCDVGSGIGLLSGSGKASFNLDGFDCIPNGKLRFHWRIHLEEVQGGRIGELGQSNQL